MTKMLMPYGSSHYANLVSKVGTVKSRSSEKAQLMPYGSAECAGLVAKVGSVKIEATPARTRQVVRLNAARR